VAHPALRDKSNIFFASTAYQIRFDKKISMKAMDKESEVFA
jgi:hypothetical protein